MRKPRVMIVDDEQTMLLAMEAVLARLGSSVIKCSHGQEALEVLQETEVDLIISDIQMPVMTGSELLAKLRESFPNIPVVMITAYGTINQAVEAMKNGAYDFITKPFSAEDLEGVVERVIRPAAKKSSAKSTSEKKSDSVAIITNDSQFKRILEVATTIAQSTASVLVQGESGTGKELIARLIHSSSRRRTGPFVAVNCAAVPGDLLESELFGHEKGAFTGAVSTKVGKFEQANGGTILLDEISEMELVLQAKLLRVLQEREVDRVGGAKPIPIDVRVVATTNREIHECIAEGQFREDLYYRLNVVPLFIPPLRERQGDIRLLIEHFVRRYAQNNKMTPDAVLEKLEHYQWPGNIRELQNACERAVLLSQSEELSHDDFMLGTTMKERGSSNSDLQLRSGLSVAEAEKRLIFETLRSTGNNKTKAAELLGISIRTLRNKLHEYDSHDESGRNEKA